MPEEISHQQMVKEVAEIATDLCNDWELGFIEDMQAWKGEFTEKQKAVIEKLYKRACESDL